MNNKDVSRRVLWMFIALAVTFLTGIATRILVFLAGVHEVDGELEFRSEKAFKLIVNHGKALDLIVLICILLVAVSWILFGKYSRGVFRAGVMAAVFVLVTGCRMLLYGNPNLGKLTRNLLDTAYIVAYLVCWGSILLYAHSMKKHVAAVRDKKEETLWKGAFFLSIVYVGLYFAYVVLSVAAGRSRNKALSEATSMAEYRKSLNTGGRKVLNTVTKVVGKTKTVSFYCMLLWFMLCLWLLYRVWKKRASEPKAEEKRTEPTVLSLELTDTEWPAAEITHDRNIARGIVYDGEGFFYFVHVDRDDAFGKATVIETPGGGVEEGEDLAAAIRRELSEELGADVDVIGKIALISDYYNVIGRHNLSNYFLCKVRSFGEKHLTKDEIEDFHLQTLRLTYEQALAEYEKNREYPFGRLVANREVPVLQWAKQWIEKD